MKCARSTNTMPRTKFKARCLAFWIMALLLGIAAPAHSLTTQEREIVAGMRQAITALRGKLREAESANRSYLRHAQVAREQVQVLQESAKAAEIAAAALAAERDQLAADYAIQTEHLKRVNKRYQTAQFIIAVAVAGFVGLLAFQLAAAIPLQYRVGASAGAALLSAAIVYMVL